MSNAWDHLPNAKHIDKVLAHVKAHPEKWQRAWNDSYEILSPTSQYMKPDGEWFTMWSAAWDAAYEKSVSIGRINLWGACQDVTWTIIQGSGRNSAWGALHALMIYDDCTYMLDLTPEQIHLYACLGVPAAVLLEPAVRAMYNE